MPPPTPNLLNNPFESIKYFYPQDLGSVGQEPYTIIQVRTSGGANSGSPVSTISLPLPAELKASYSAEYENKEMYLDKRWANLQRGMSSASEAGGGSYSHAWDDIVDAITRMGASATNVIGTNDALERKSGKIINPHMAVLFRNIPFREFSFSWNLFAKNKEESEQIKGIIHTFKYAMHPRYDRANTDSTVNTTFFVYPEHFIVAFYSPTDKYLFKLTPSFLVNFEVDYAGSQFPSFFYETGAPVHVKISTTFKETEVLTKERIALGY